MNANSMNPEDSGTPADAGRPGNNAPGGAAGSGPAEEPSARSYTTGSTGPGAWTSQQNFFDWIRSQGVRRGPDRWLGGVASGVAHRFGIDPLIVRGIFIVLALFAGVGVLLYGLAWALLPEPDGRIHVQEAAAGRWSGGMTGALATSIIGLPSLGRGFWGWGWNGLPGLFWTLFWVGGVAYLIYYLVQRNNSQKGGSPMDRQSFGAPAATASGTAAPTAPSGTPGTAYGPSASTSAPASTTATAGTNTGVPVYGPGSTSTPVGPYTPSGPRPPRSSGPGSSGPGGSGPGGSGPYGQAPYGSGPVQPPKPPRQKAKGPGAAIVAVSAGTALLAGGTLKALDVANAINLGSAADSVVWAVGAAILGLGILVAGLRGRTSGVLGFLAIVALVVGGIFNVIPRNGDRFAFHEVNWAPVSIEQARMGLKVTGANGTVDLSDLHLTPPLTQEVTVPLDATASNITVIIPDDVPVEVRADMTFGNLNERGADRGGRFQDDRSTYNTDKPGANLVVEIDGTFSNVTVKEGN